MKLSVLHSGSKGNCYLLTADNGQILIIECGIPMKEIKKGLNWDVGNVIGCISSHEHKDHLGSAKDIIGSGINLYALQSSLESAGVWGSTLAKAIESLKGYKIGSFKVFTLPVAHDVPCLAFVISHEEMGKTLFVTDTMMLEYTIKGLNHIMLECNYDDESLQWAIDNGFTPPQMRSRLLQSHMELQTTLGVLESNDLSQVNEIILLHLSGRNSNSGRYIDEVQKRTGKPTYVACMGLELQFDQACF